jgi:hypothetical protein
MDVTFTRCAQPHLTSRRISTYTILGFIGYGVANLAGGVLANHWQLSLGERIIAFFVPPLAFIAVVFASKVILGRERIVFYQTTVAAVAGVVAIGLVAGADLARLLDLVTLGIGTFLVFGRIGCYAVACCHGTLGRGVTYGAPHVQIGFWPRWSGRALWPVQLGEATASGALVLAGLASSAQPGRAALIYVLGYAAVRFLLELARGDGARPYLLGLSEAQWVAVATSIACAAWRPEILTYAFAAALAAGAGVLITLRRRRELLFPPHLLELDGALQAAGDGESHETSLGVRVSRHVLPDGRTDWILSSPRLHGSAALARRIAHRMWLSFEIVPGRTAGVFHVLTK